MMAYVYGGDKHDLAEPLPPVEPVAPAETPAGCGTYGAFQRHKRRGEEVDAACRDAHKLYMREWRRTHPKSRTERPAGTYTPGVCGDHNGYERHRRNNTTPCKPCRTGHAEYTAKRKQIREQQAAERSKQT